MLATNIFCRYFYDLQAKRTFLKHTVKEEIYCLLELCRLNPLCGCFRISESTRQIYTLNGDLMCPKYQNIVQIFRFVSPSEVSARNEAKLDEDPSLSSGNYVTVWSTWSRDHYLPSSVWCDYDNCQDQCHDRAFAKNYHIRFHTVLYMYNNGTLFQYCAVPYLHHITCNKHISALSREPEFSYSSSSFGINSISFKLTVNVGSSMLSLTIRHAFCSGPLWSHSILRCGRYKDAGLSCRLAGRLFNK